MKLIYSSAACLEKYFKIKRLIALFSAFTFLFSNPVVAQTFPHSPAMKSFERLPAPDLITLPTEWGRVEEFYQAPHENKLVILVQDAHAIPDAQRNIQKIILHFQKEYGLGLVALEGASSNLDMQILKSFPDKEILKKTFEDYLQKGELTGSTAAAIFNNSETIYQGVEDWELYEKGLALYLAAMKDGSALLEKFFPLEKDLQAKKEAIYSKQLLDIDRAFQSFRENHSNITEILKLLAEVKRPDKGTELALLLEESERNFADQGPIEIEVKRIAKTIEQYLNSQPPSSKSSNSLQSFHEKYQDFQTSRISPQAFALFLKELMSHDKLPVKISGELSRLMKNQKRMRDIEGTRFFRDFENYVDSVKKTLLRNEEERRLDKESRKHEILGRLIKLELSRQDWKEVKASIADLKASLPQDSLEPHIAFYENAEKRDQTFTENLIPEMQKNKTELALLVAGGFHTEGLTQRLKEKDTSYLLIMPQISSLPQQSHYEQYMRGEVSWRNYFEIENGKINLYKAFVRGTRDALLKQTQDAPILIKNWRDQIIRDLASIGKLSQAGRYTHFLDEISFRKGLSEPSAKVDRFIKELHSLKSQGRFNEQNVLKLLQPSTVQSAFLVPGTQSKLTARLIHSQELKQWKNIPQAGRRETVPRREPVRVPEEVPEETPLPVPAEPQPEPVEPAQEPEFEPAEDPAEPEQVPAGSRSELRKQNAEALRDFQERMRMDSQLATAANLRWVMSFIPDAYPINHELTGEIRKTLDLLSALNPNAFNETNQHFFLKKLKTSDDWLEAGDNASLFLEYFFKANPSAFSPSNFKIALGLSSVSGFDLWAHKVKYWLRYRQKASFNDLWVWRMKRRQASVTLLGFFAKADRKYATQKVLNVFLNIFELGDREARLPEETMEAIEAVVSANPSLANQNNFDRIFAILNREAKPDAPVHSACSF